MLRRWIFWIPLISSVAFLLALPLGMWSAWMMGAATANQMMMASINRHIVTAVVGGVIVAPVRPLFKLLLAWNIVIVPAWCFGIMIGIAML